MTLHIDAIVALFPDLDSAELTLWVGRRWVEPDVEAGRDALDEAAWRFDEIDVARVRMIYDLRRDLDVSPEAIPLILSLVDQIYELRCAMHRVAGALEEQSGDVRDAILGAVRRR